MLNYDLYSMKKKVAVNKDDDDSLIHSKVISSVANTVVAVAAVVTEFELAVADLHLIIMVNDVLDVIESRLQ